MKSFRHWTPRYVKDRIIEMNYQRRSPDLPWLTSDANRILETYLLATDVGLELGSGRSTIWFADRTKHLMSLEAIEDWHERVRLMLARAGKINVDYRFIPLDKPPLSGDQSAFVRALDAIGADTMDYVLVDGPYRDFCTR